MIQLKEKPDAPKILNGKRVKKILKSLKQKYDSKEEIKSDDFKPIWTSDSVKNKLYNHHKWKCCYCEQKREKKRDSDVEHFRPKTEIDGVGKPGYWWLAYDWDNLFISCKQCNQAFKGTLFPLLDSNRGNFEDGVDEERPVLIEPTNEKPENFIAFRWTSGRNKPIVDIDIVKPIGIDAEGRGNGTIRICGLDREYLNKERGGRTLHRLYYLSKYMNKFLNENNEEAITDTAEIILEETSADSPFAGFKRAYFCDQGLGDYVSAD